MKNTKHSLLWALLLLCVALSGVAVADEQAEDALRPGKNDPHLKSRTMLASDSMIVIHRGLAGNNDNYRSLFGISPDKTVIGEFKNKQKFNEKKDSGDVLFSRISHEFMMDDEGNPYIIASGKMGGNDAYSNVKAVPAGSLNPDLQNAREIDTAKKHLHTAFVTGNWDNSGMTNAFVISRKADHQMYAQGFTNVKYDEKTGKWSEPKLGAVQNIHGTFATLGRFDNQTRWAAGDLTGNGGREIVLAFRTGTDTYTYNIKVLSVAYDEKSTAEWKYVLRTIADYELDFKWNHKLAGNFDVYDVAVGDVDGDGMDEILFVGLADDGDKADKAALRWRMLKLKDNKIVRMKDGPPIFAGNPRTVSYYMVRCVMADVDSDGRAEPVVLHTNSSEQAILGGCKYSSVTDENKFSSLLLSDSKGTMAIDLVSGNFTGDLVKGAANGNAAQVAYGVMTTANHTRARVVPWDTAKKEFKYGAGNCWDSSVPCPGGGHDNPMRLVVGDFRKSSIVLGRPTHIVKEKDLSVLVVMQEPPKHLDYTLREGTKYDVVNLTRVKDFFTNFYDMKSTTKGVVTGQSSSSNIGVGLNADVKVGHKAKLKGVGGHDVSVKLSSGLDKSWEEKASKINESYKGSSSEIKASTTADDYVAYSIRTLDIWRYPILGQKSLVSKDHQLWHTVTIPSPDAAKRFTGAMTPGFQPAWCNGNILSYPRNKNMIGDYRDNLLLGGHNEFSVDNNKMSYTIGWTEDVKKQETRTGSTRLKSDASIEIDAKASFMGFYTNVGVKAKMYADKLNSETSTNTTALNTKTSFTVENQGSFPDVLNNSNIYNVTPIVYETPNGVFKVAYTADIPDASLKWWLDRYSSAPDPALNLPNLWVAKSGGWQKDDDATRNPNARRIRGFFISKNGANLQPGIDETGTVDLHCRVHNFAMKYADESDANAKATAKNVNVKFEYVQLERGSEKGKRTLIKDVSIPEIPVWNNKTRGNELPNWKFAEVSWDITGVPDGNYRIHVTANSDKKIKELPYHGLNENYDNNRGWFDVAIAKPKKPTAETMLALADELGEQVDDLDDFSAVAQVNLHEEDHQIEYAFGGGQIIVSADIMNSGPDPALNVLVTLYDGDGTSGDVLAHYFIPGVFPGESIPVTFVVDVDEDHEGFVTLHISEEMGELDPSTNMVVSKKPGSGSGGGGCSTGVAGGILLLALTAAIARKHAHNVVNEAGGDEDDRRG